ncbi:hypothetical protein BCIN_15g04080 [Botrytis cinerea B05.10]|uniref:Uncharacterized protein n=2 Tax=Botryotinia fuckeliana TaxID=40559 RepID=A0A384K5S3_BOTFB|nr:hypothetical protein BCIN_15g04080 [Botrytis cinerea B05.10]ATZ57897.1 hypothetical protein BCIN_15g04080 [Botrytis cinerea B05.10]EMR82021.1 hypothetical protein BcDW1_9297 [Botrytis cinerea BcDW1]
MMEVKNNAHMAHLNEIRRAFLHRFMSAPTIGPKQIKDFEETVEKLPLVRYYGGLPEMDSPWYPFLFAVSNGRIVHKPPHALERLGLLIRKTQYLVRVEVSFWVIFLVESIDNDGRLIFVEIDRHFLRPLESAVLPEWLQGMFFPNAGKELEWICDDFGQKSHFKCSPWSRALTSWW